MHRPSLTRALAPSLLSALLLAGCSGAAPGESEADTGIAEEAISSLPAVTVQDSGTWDTVTDCGYYGAAYSCFYANHFWIDLSVANLAYSKTVGVIWTDDGWKTNHTSYAAYKAGLPYGREKWGLDVTFSGGLNQSSYSRTVEYAVFATQNGQTAWDPLDNHLLNHGELNLAHPDRVLDTSFTYDRGRGGTVMSGTVTVLNLAYDKQVTIRATTDGWQTSRDVDATWTQGNDFAFTVPNLGLVPPAMVQYAIRYRTAGVEIWDNNGGANYAYDVAPRFSESTWTDLSSGAQGLSGIYQSYVSVSGGLPLSDITCTLDGQPVGSCNPYTYAAYGGASALLSTAGLADGAHTLGFAAHVTGGYVANYSLPFTVQNRVSVAAPFALSAPAVALARDAASKLYVLYGDGSVTRHDGYGQAGTLVVTADPQLASSSYHDLAVDPQGRIHTLWNADGTAQIRRYLADGTLDATFAGGMVSVGPSQYCTNELALAGGNVYALDGCSGILRGFDGQGAALPDTGLGNAYGAGVCGDGNQVWVAAQDQILEYQVGASGLTLAATHAASGIAYSPRLACTGGALRVLGGGHLSAVDASFALTPLWSTGSYSGTGLAGYLDYNSPLVRLADGSLVGLANGTLQQLTPLP